MRFAALGSRSTSNALGIDEIYLCGITPTPLDKKGRERSDFAKVALGAEKKALWHYEENTVSIIKKLKEEGYLIIAIEQDKKSVDYKSVDISKYDKVAFLVGPEVTAGSDARRFREKSPPIDLSARRRARFRRPHGRP